MVKQMKGNCQHWCLHLFDLLICSTWRGHWPLWGATNDNFCQNGAAFTLSTLRVAHCWATGLIVYTRNWISWRFIIITIIIFVSLNLWWWKGWWKNRNKTLKVMFGNQIFEDSSLTFLEVCKMYIWQCKLFILKRQPPAHTPAHTHTGFIMHEFLTCRFPLVRIF